jgi:hypothetical protein
MVLLNPYVTDRILTWFRGYLADGMLTSSEVVHDPGLAAEPRTVSLFIHVLFKLTCRLQAPRALNPLSKPKALGLEIVSYALLESPNVFFGPYRSPPISLDD